MRISDWSSDVCSSDLRQFNVAADTVVRIKHRKMPTGDITAAIAGALLRTKVPADDIAIRIEHEDRVVLDAIDKQAEALLAQTQQFLLLASLAEITRDFGEAAKFAAVVDQPRDDDVRPECAAILAHPPAFVLEAAVFARSPQLVKIGRAH